MRLFLIGFLGLGLIILTGLFFAGVLPNNSEISKNPLLKKTPPLNSTNNLTTPKTPLPSAQATKKPISKQLNKLKKESEKAFEDYFEDEISQKLEEASTQAEEDKIYPLLKESFDVMVKGYANAKAEENLGRLENMKDSMEDLKEIAKTLNGYKGLEWAISE